MTNHCEKCGDPVYYTDMIGETILVHTKTMRVECENND